MLIHFITGMIQSYFNEYGEDGIGAVELVAALGDNLVEILFAGYNTVVNVIANALFFLATNPEWFPKFQAEIDTVLQGRLKPLTSSHLFSQIGFFLNSTLNLRTCSY